MKTPNNSIFIAFFSLHAFLKLKDLNFSPFFSSILLDIDDRLLVAKAEEKRKMSLMINTIKVCLIFTVSTNLIKQIPTFNPCIAGSISTDKGFEPTDDVIIALHHPMR